MDKIFGVPFNEFPLELRIAADIYHQCWHSLPIEMKTPSEDDILNYIKDNHTEIPHELIYPADGQRSAFLKRIYQLSKPANPPKRKHKSYSDFKILRER